MINAYCKALIDTSDALCYYRVMSERDIPAPKEVAEEAQQQEQAAPNKALERFERTVEASRNRYNKKSLESAFNGVRRSGERIFSSPSELLIGLARMRATMSEVAQNAGQEKDAEEFALRKDELEAAGQMLRRITTETTSPSSNPRRTTGKSSG